MLHESDEAENVCVSIVIPTYNRATDLARSVIAQTYCYWECIVVDNHSTDNTDQVVKGFDDNRIKLFKINNNGVIAASRNLGIRHAKGKYIAFLDSDDWWSAKKLEVSLEYLDRGADIVFHDMWQVKNSHQRIFWRRVGVRSVVCPVFNDLITNGNALVNSSVVVRINLLHQIGGLLEDRELIAAEDFECWLRISKLTENFVCIPSVLGYYWTGGGNTSNATRFLLNLVVLKKLHMTDRYITLPIWWQYAMARCLYLLGKRAEAAPLLLQLHRKDIKNRNNFFRNNFFGKRLNPSKINR